MPAKIAALDDALLVDGAAVGRTDVSSPGRVSIVALVGRLRHLIHDTSMVLPPQRRRLVVLDLLASCRPTPGTAWSRPLERLLAEATSGTDAGMSAADVLRLARRLERSRRTLRVCTVPGPVSAVGALAEATGGVFALSPGAATVSAALLLSGVPVTERDFGRAGGMLLDPAPPDPDGLLAAVDPATPIRYLGTILALESHGMFLHELATLAVAAELSPTVASYAGATLPALAADLWRAGVARPDEEHAGRLRAGAQSALAVARALPSGGGRRPALRLRRS